MLAIKALEQYKIEKEGFFGFFKLGFLSPPQCKIVPCCILQCFILPTLKLPRIERQNISRFLNFS